MITKWIQKVCHRGGFLLKSYNILHNKKKKDKDWDSIFFCRQYAVFDISDAKSVEESSSDQVLSKESIEQLLFYNGDDQATDRISDEGKCWSHTWLSTSEIILMTWYLKLAKYKKGEVIVKCFR